VSMRSRGSSGTTTSPSHFRYTAIGCRAIGTKSLPPWTTCCRKWSKSLVPQSVRRWGQTPRRSELLERALPSFTHDLVLRIIQGTVDWSPTHLKAATDEFNCVGAWQR